MKATPLWPWVVAGIAVSIISSVVGFLVLLPVCIVWVSRKLDGPDGDGDGDS